jgi:hypothetical protein
MGSGLPTAGSTTSATMRSTSPYTRRLQRWRGAVGPVVSGDSDQGAPAATVHLHSSHTVDVAEMGGDAGEGGGCLYETVESKVGSAECRD